MQRRKFILKGSSGLACLIISPFSSNKENASSQININQQNENNMYTRMKTFDVPHKGIRNGLSQLSLLAGKTNYNNRREIERLNLLGKEVFLLLNTHAQDENDVSLKYLEQKMKGASDHDIEEHVRLHVMQSRLEKMLDTIDEDGRNSTNASGKGSEFYSLLADFHSEYLHHMSEEERITQQLLWDHFTDEELTEHRVEIMKKLPPDTLLLWFKYIVPAQSHDERVGLFKGFKKNAPKDLYKKAEHVLSKVLDEAEFRQLIGELQ